MIKFLKEDKLNMITLFKSGMRKSDIIKRYGIDKRSFYMLLMSYEERGLKGLDTLPHIIHDDEKKRSVIRDYESRLLSLRQIAVKNAISLTTVKTWIKKHKSGILFPCSQNTLKSPNMRKPRKKELDRPKEDLVRELEYLRAENALLKKVKALVEKECRQNKPGHQPSRS